MSQVLSAESPRIMPGHIERNIVIQFKSTLKGHQRVRPDNGGHIARKHKTIIRVILTMAFGLPTIAIFWIPGLQPITGQALSAISMTVLTHQTIGLSPASDLILIGCLTQIKA